MKIKRGYIRDIEAAAKEIEKMQPNMKALELYDEVKNRLKENTDNLTSAQV